MPAMGDLAARIWAGVRKPPRNEPAVRGCAEAAAYSAMGIY